MPKIDLYLSPPLMNAAGFLGFAPDVRCGVDFTRLGAFVTNPISRAPRSPARERGCQPFSGGFLLHTGMPNPGFSAVLKKYADGWARSPLPVIVHLLVGQLGEIDEMARRLESREGVMGIELGFAEQASESDIWASTQAAAGELPVIACLPLGRAAALAGAAIEAGASAISLSAPRGALPAPGSAHSTQGRLYGPAVFPLALRVVDELRRSGIPVIAGGGSYRPRDAEAFLQAGALAVQVDGMLWRGGINAPASSAR